MLVPESRMFLVGTIAWLAFFAFVTWHQLRSVLAASESHRRNDRMAISVYLLIGLTWGLLYIVLFQCQDKRSASRAAPPSASNRPHISTWSSTVLTFSA